MKTIRKLITSAVNYQGRCQYLFAFLEKGSFLVQAYVYIPMTAATCRAEWNHISPYNSE